jgi:hypothetical protein
MGRRGYPPEFRKRVLDLLDAGRKVVDLARDLGISNQTYSVRGVATVSLCGNGSPELVSRTDDGRDRGPNHGQLRSVGWKLSRATSLRSLRPASMARCTGSSGGSPLIAAIRS